MLSECIGTPSCTLGGVLEGVPPINIRRGRRVEGERAEGSEKGAREGSGGSERGAREGSARRERRKGAEGVQEGSGGSERSVRSARGGA